LLGEPPCAIERMLQVQLIDPAHQSQILFAHRTRRVVDAAPIESENLALPAHAQLWPLINHRRALGPGKRPSAESKKSLSTVSSPIFACNSRIRARSAAPSTAPAPKI